MADAVAKAVLGVLVNNWSRMAYMFDFVSNGTPDLVRSKGDSVDIPTQTAPTNRSPTTRADPETNTPSVDTMIADQELFYSNDLPPKSRAELLNGGWVASQQPLMLGTLANDRDDNLIKHTIQTVTAGQDNTAHINVAADSISAVDLASAEGKMADVKGNNRANFMYIMSAYGYASIQSVGAFIPAQANAEAGRLGIPMVTSINGIPAFLTGGGGLKDVVMTTSSAISVTTNVATATVPSGHGVVAGQLISTEGATTDTAATGVVVTSVTDTTIVYPLTAADGALADGVADIKAASSMTLLFDRTKIFKASQIMPRVKIEGDYRSAKEALQVYTCFARQALANSAVVIHSPRDSA